GLIVQQFMYGFAVLLAQPVGKPRNGRQRRERLELRQFDEQLIDYSLEQEIAEADAAQAWLSIGNRIEDGPARLGGIARRQSGVQQHLDVARHRARKRDLDENQRHVAHAWMEKSVAAALAGDAVLELIPGADFVDSLV